MPISSQMIGIHGDQCNCGRRATIRHCPACGSARVYGRSGRMHTHLNGEVKLVKTEFRCQACTHLFIDEEREFCEAPAVGSRLAAQRVRALAEAKASGEYLRPKEDKAAESLQALIDSQQKVGTTEQQQAARKKLIFDLRSCYADLLLEFKLGRASEHPGKVEDFIIHRMSELKQPVPTAEELQS